MRNLPPGPPAPHWQNQLSAGELKGTHTRRIVSAMGVLGDSFQRVGQLGWRWVEVMTRAHFLAWEMPPESLYLRQDAL